MADFFSSLTSTSRALDAQRYGIDMVGQNIANANTPGYSRRTVDFAAVAPDSPQSAGRGVEVVGVRALRDRLVELRLLQETPAQQRESAMASQLAIVQSAIGQAGSSIDGSLDSFFSAFSDLAQDPTSSVARREVQLQGDTLASAFNDMASRFDSARNDADHQVRSNVDQINTLAAQIAALNHNLATSPTPETRLSVADDQEQLVQKLSQLVDLNVLDRADGGVDISIANGHPLVVGDTAYAIDATSTPPDGHAALSINGADITSAITGGTLGGMLHVRDVDIPGYQAQLDQLAYDVADQVNTLHAAGYDQSGAAGGDFFSFSSTIVGSTGAAAAIQLDPAIAADATKIAAAGIAEPGDNQVARQLAALRDTRVLDGGTSTLSDHWGQLVYSIGRDVKDAQDQNASRTQIVSQVDALRDQVSGVSLDEEATQLLKFQRAYEANAKFFQVVDQALQTLMQAMGG
jgi:flagellar hook-associated protein 1 FlgK